MNKEKRFSFDRTCPFCMANKKGLEAIAEQKKQISQLKADLDFVMKEHEKMQKSAIRETEDNLRLKRQINCVKNYTQIKPLYCCWMADSFILKELKEQREGEQG